MKRTATRIPQDRFTELTTEVRRLVKTTPIGRYDEVCRRAADLAAKYNVKPKVVHNLVRFTRR